jgi:hypothetical protein
LFATAQFSTCLKPCGRSAEHLTAEDDGGGRPRSTLHTPTLVVLWAFGTQWKVETENHGRVVKCARPSLLIKK